MSDGTDIAYAVETRDLSFRYGRDTLAVDGVTLEVRKGEIFGLVGPDGAGKSTLIRMLATVLRPTGGGAAVFGDSVTESARLIKPRIGYMSQRFSLYGDLSVRENLTFFAELRGVPRNEVYSRGQRLLEFMGIDEFANRHAEYLSGGMKQKLALAATLIHEPDILFLDEPTTGVDPVSRREFWRIIAELHQRGITVFVATPYMDEAERCTRVAFMDSGRILFSDTPADLKRRVPGTTYEIHVEDQRRALDILLHTPGVSSAFIYGDALRVTVEPDGPDAEMLADLVDCGPSSHVTPMQVDMEAAFAFLAAEARRARPATAPDADDTPDADAAAPDADDTPDADADNGAVV